MNFRKTSKGGEGSFPIQKIPLQIFGIINGFLVMNICKINDFPKKRNIVFRTKGGGGLSKAVWSFLKVHPNLGTQASLGGAFIKNLNSETALTLIWMPQFFSFEGNFGLGETTRPHFGITILSPTFCWQPFSMSIDLGFCASDLPHHMLSPLYSDPSNAEHDDGQFRC